MFLFLITGVLFFRIKHEAVGLFFAISSFSLITFLITTHQRSAYVFPYFLILHICEFIGRHCETCKVGQIFPKYLTAIAVNILITLVIVITKLPPLSFISAH